MKVAQKSFWLYHSYVYSVEADVVAVSRREVLAGSLRSMGVVDMYIGGA